MKDGFSFAFKMLRLSIALILALIGALFFLVASWFDRELVEQSLLKWGKQ